MYQLSPGDLRTDLIGPKASKDNSRNLIPVTERKLNERYSKAMTNTNPYAQQLDQLGQSFTLKADTLATHLDSKGLGRVAAAAQASQNQLNFRPTV